MTNNQPAVIGGYFVSCVKALGGCPTIIRADRGTENGTVAALQRMFRHGCGDEFSGEKSFMYGPSTANQRIEAWWRQLKKNGAHWWTDFFKDLQSQGQYDGSNRVHVDCLRYCFMPVIQKELAEIACEWNAHRIRPSQQAEAPGGIPDILYFVPETQGVQRHRFPISAEALQAADTYVNAKPCAVPPEFAAAAEYICREESLAQPSTAVEAKELYLRLVQELDT